MDDFDTFDFWQDDFEVYNQNEADDYRHENDEPWECCDHCPYSCHGFHNTPCECQEFDLV